MSYYLNRGFSDVSADALGKLINGTDDCQLVVDGFGPLTVTGRAEAGRLLFAHGAGAGHSSAFITRFITMLAQQGLQVFAIDFPYMQLMNEQGKRRPPPAVQQSVSQLAAWYRLLSPLDTAPLWVGGKSMGGRVASMLASEQVCPGVVVAGYPFHPPKKPNSLRIAHFADTRCPMLILQGERDPFGTVEDVQRYTLPENLEVQWVPDGDHDFKPRRISGLNHTVLIDEAATFAASFVRAKSLLAVG